MSKKPYPTEKEFLKSVEKHQMTVIREDGVHRHIRFKKPGTMNQYFDLITWPGCLCYTGDMGTYVFQRLEDMFEFFRTDRLQPKDGRTLFINLGYWSEKLIATDRCGVTEYSEKKFREAITEWLDEAEASEEVRAAVEEDVLIYADHDGDEARRAAIDFEHDGFRFNDFWEVDCTEYVYRFVWCCYAIAWGIQQDDTSKASAAA